MKVERIEPKRTHEWLLHKHYLRRLSSISFAFGLFEEDKLIGVCTFGSALPMQLKRGICGVEFQDRVFELNRLCVMDDLPRNTLSFFVGQCLKMLPKPTIVVSYADVSQHHHGYIYQATNFLYTGTSHVQQDWRVEGKEHLHPRALLDEMKGVKGRVKLMKEKYGDKMYRITRAAKHRYIYFCADKKDKKLMRKNLRYEVQPYPKGKNERYDSSYIPVEQLSLLTPTQ